MESVRFGDSDSTVELSFFVHFSEGLGSPAALQKRVTFVPLRTCGDCGDTVISGGTTCAEKKKSGNKIPN